MKSFLLSMLFALLLVAVVFGALIEYKFLMDFGVSRENRTTFSLSMPTHRYSPWHDLPPAPRCADSAGNAHEFF